MVITLSSAEMMVAANVATMRGVQNLKRRVAERHGSSMNISQGFIEPNVSSCMAEMAVAKALGLYWSGEIGNYKARDVGGLVDVRSSRRASNHLILHDDDPDDVPFVSVSVAEPEFTLHGWVLARDGKRKEFWRTDTGRAAYFVPRSALRPMDELMEMVRAPARAG